MTSSKNPAGVGFLGPSHHLFPDAFQLGECVCVCIGTRLDAGRVSHVPRAAADFPEDAKDPHMTAYIESARMMGWN